MKYKLEIIISLFSLVLTIIAIEVFCRFHYYGKFIFHQDSQEYKFWQYDKDIGWSPTPLSKGHFQSSDFNGYVEFDKNGIRINNNTPKSHHELNILIIGDSITAGLEVDNEKTFAALLEKKFLRNGHLISVYNAGVRGYGTDQSYWRMMKLWQIVQPDYVLYMVCGNDFTENRTIKKEQRLYSKPAYIQKNGFLDIYNHPAKLFNNEYFSYIFYNENGPTIAAGNMKDHMLFLQKLDRILIENIASYRPIRLAFRKIGGNGNHPTKPPEHDGQIEYETMIFKKILQLMNYKKNLIVSSFTYGDETWFKKYVVRSTEELEIPYFDMDPYFTEDHSKYHWKNDGHWNEKGHAIVAEGLYANFKQFFAFP